MSNVSGKEKLPVKFKTFINKLGSEENEGHWEFTVYATYASSSGSPPDEAFDRNIYERFQSCIEAYLRANVEELYGVKIPLDIEFIRLPGASILDARTHFDPNMAGPRSTKDNDRHPPLINVVVHGIDTLLL
jgi:hypothetical protein